MDWKIIAATFGAVFVAELADKTQLVGISLSAKSGKPWTVWVGSVAAYMVVTALSVFLGAVVGKYIRPEMLKIGGAGIFIIIGILMLWGKL